MSYVAERKKGKRFSRARGAASNAQKNRWKFLSANTHDANDSTAPEAQMGATSKRSHLLKASLEHHENQKGYDIDGDGLVDVREMRLAQYLDEIINRHKLTATSEPSEEELDQMRQRAGRLLMAKEFIERNHERLWRYGSIFADKNEEQSANYLANHKNFQKLMPYLETMERERVLRSSHQVRNQLFLAPTYHKDHFLRQTWLETSRKQASGSSPLSPKNNPLPMITKPQRLSQEHQALEAIEQGEGEYAKPVTMNSYGAIDIDGDGVVDSEEMKVNTRLKMSLPITSTSGSLTAQQKQRQRLEGRKLMARDFVERNATHLHCFDPKYHDLSHEEIVDLIAYKDDFATEFNNLRGKERLLTLKSSIGVSNCLVQGPPTSLSVDKGSSQAMRRVKDRSELFASRLALTKHENEGGQGGKKPLVLESKPPPLSCLRSEPASVVGLPHIYDSPQKLEPMTSLSISKWKFQGEKRVFK